MSFAPNGRRTVLVAEDSPTEQAMVADCLHEAGYSVVLAGAGDEVSEKRGMACTRAANSNEQRRAHDATAARHSLDVGH